MVFPFILTNPLINKFPNYALKKLGLEISLDTDNKRYIKNFLLKTSGMNFIFIYHTTMFTIFVYISYYVYHRIITSTCILAHNNNTCMHSSYNNHIYIHSVIIKVTSTCTQGHNNHLYGLLAVIIIGMHSQ